MRVHLTINGASEEIEILEPMPAARFRWQGAERAADVRMPDPGLYSVLIGGLSYDVAVEHDANGLVVTIGNHRFEVQVRDPRRWSRKSGAPGREGVEALSTPMPGKVVRILAAPGDAVEAGQGILVVEAMKMQNEMKASRTGRVLTITAVEGATVAAGETLATIDYGSGR